MATVVDIPTSLLFWDCCSIDALSPSASSLRQAFLYLPWIGFVELASDGFIVAGISMMLLGFVAMGLRGILCGGRAGHSVKFVSVVTVALLSICCSVLVSPEAQMYVSTGASANGMATDHFAARAGRLLSRALVGFAGQYRC
jgi:hypothetical protein